jgi:ubiquinone/menaquinone biosynthesis C-methylase UbiE
MERDDLDTILAELDSFTRVDHLQDPSAAVSYLDAASSLDAVQSYKRKTFSLLNLQEGSYILDVGCGTGDDVRALAQLVGSFGRVVGVDNSETMVAEARKRSEGLGLPVEYRVSDAHELPFADSTFDGCRADRVFQHLTDPRKALAELVRVARQGARVVVSDPDWEILLIDAGDRALTRKVANFMCDSVSDGWMGRRLYALFKGSGLRDISVTPEVLVIPDFNTANQIFSLQLHVERAQEAGVITRSEGEAWLADLHQRSEKGTFFFATGGFAASGRKA